MTKASVVLLCAIVSLAGCHGDASVAPTLASAIPRATAAPGVKRGPSPEELTAGMVEAVTVGKSTVPVLVKFDVPQRPIVGQPFEVVVAVMPQIVAEVATLVVTGGDALPVKAGAGPVEMPSVEPTQVYRHNISVTATADGVQLLGLSVAMKHDDVLETRTFSVPVIVLASEAPAGPTKH